MLKGLQQVVHHDGLTLVDPVLVPLCLLGCGFEHEPGGLEAPLVELIYAELRSQGHCCGDVLVGRHVPVGGDQQTIPRLGRGGRVRGVHDVAALGQLHLHHEVKPVVWSVDVESEDSRPPSHRRVVAVHVLAQIVFAGVDLLGDKERGEDVVAAGLALSWRLHPVLELIPRDVVILPMSRIWPVRIGDRILLGGHKMHVPS